VANKLMQNNVFSSMVAQFICPGEHEQMQRELASVKEQLARASKSLAQKEQTIYNLQEDIAHMLIQFDRLNTVRSN